MQLLHDRIDLLVLVTASHLSWLRIQACLAGSLSEFEVMLPLMLATNDIRHLCTSYDLPPLRNHCARLQSIFSNQLQLRCFHIVQKSMDHWCETAHAMPYQT